MDLAGINFSGFAIACSIKSKMYDKFLYQRVQSKMGHFAKLSTRKQ